MNAASRLALYGLGVVVAFGGAFGIAGAVVPDSAVAAWTQAGETNDHKPENTETSPQPATVDQVDGFTVSVEGDLVAGAPSELSISVTRDGTPVASAEPHLGSFGHIVSLPEADLTYVQAHADDQKPRASNGTGADIAFTAQAPTAGRYLLHLNFQVDGKVHTAQFVLDTAQHDAANTPNESHAEGH